jgi:hypothetical protein
MATTATAENAGRAGIGSRNLEVRLRTLAIDVCKARGVLLTGFPLSERLLARRGVSAMARGKQTSKRTRRRTALPVLGAAGASLAMTGAASAALPTDDVQLFPDPAFVLDEEEISDVSLGTFYVFDRIVDRDLLPIKVAARGGCRGCGGGAGRCGGGGRCAAARCGGGRCAVARCGGCRCGVGVVGCRGCGCTCSGCSGACWIVSGFGWAYVC